MSSEKDLQIRELYRRLKEEDESFAPTFGQTLEAGDSRVPVWPFRLKVAVSILAVILFATPALIYLTRSPLEPGTELAADVLEWESPTDFLLSYSDDPLLMTAPSINMEVPYWAEEEVLERLESEANGDDS